MNDPRVDKTRVGLFEPRIAFSMTHKFFDEEGYIDLPRLVLVRLGNWGLRRGFCPSNN
jgi:hypothetical protein